MTRVQQILTATLMLLTLLAGVKVASAAVPAIVMSNHQTLYSSLTNGTSRVSANARGDLFFADPPNHRVLELPAGSTTPVVLLINMNSTTSTSAPNSIDVDSAGNVYANNTYGGRVIRIPFVNGSYPTGVDASDATLKATTCQTNMTTDCVLQTLGALTGYYAQTGDMTMDGAGNYYFVDVNDSVSNGAYNRIVELTASGTVKIVVDNLTTAANAQIVADTAGNLYYANSVALYSIPAGATTATAINTTSLSKPTGVTIDFAGNLIVSDSGNSRIVVIPYENGALNLANQYLLAPTYTQNSIGIDSFGTIYYTGTSGGASSISALQTSAYAASSLAVGSSTTSALVYASFNTSTTLSQIYTHANGATVTASVNSCVLGTTYAAAKSCSFNAQIKPTRVGPVTGLLGVADANGNVLGEFTLTTVGLGSAVSLDPGTAQTLSSSFTAPAGVAVDRAGNVFVADTAANTVYEFVGGSGTPVSLGTGLSGPTSIAVDATGDLFIADAGNGRVVKISNLGTTMAPASQVTIASGLATPIAVACGVDDALYIAQAGQLAMYEVRGTLPVAKTRVIATQYARPGALAVDPSGDLFIADQATGQVVEIAAYTGAVTSIATGLTTPSGLATDAAGNLFVVDYGTAQAVKIPQSGGVYSYATALSFGAFNAPLGLAADASGNLYVTDPSVPVLVKINRTSGLINFGNIDLSTPSPVMSGTLASSGNQTLTLGSTLYSSVSGDTTHFAFNSASSCAASAQLTAGSSCTLAFVFTPTAKGSISQVLALSALPTVTTSPFQLTLTGNGTYLAPTTLAVALTAPTGSISYGQTVTLTATLTPASYNSALPSGSVTFFIDGLAQKPVALSSNGTASIQTAGLSGGVNTVYAVYAGDANYLASTAPVVNLSVALASTTTTLTLTTTYTNPTSSLTGTSLTLSALVTPSVTGALSGVVNFVSGFTVLGSASLTGTTSGAYAASLTTSTVPAGSYSVTAVYVGNTNYTGSTSAAQSLIVASASVQLTSSATTLYTSASTPGIATLSVASLAGLTAPVTFACTGLPAYAECLFTPAYISLYSSTSATPIAPTAVKLEVVVNVVPPVTLPVVSDKGGAGRSPLYLALLLGLPVLIGLRRRSLLRNRSALLLVVLMMPVLCINISGCVATPKTVVTPTGTYAVTVTASSGTTTASLTTTSLNITVVNQ